MSWGIGLAPDLVWCGFRTRTPAISRPKSAAVRTPVRLYPRLSNCDIVSVAILGHGFVRRNQLKGCAMKVAIVTAGGSGMGAAAARRLAQDGYKIAILSSSGKGEAIAGELGGIGITGSNQSNDD